MNEVKTLDEVIDLFGKESGNTTFDYKGNNYTIYLNNASQDSHDRWAIAQGKKELMIQEANLKSQKEYPDTNFKQGARASALNIAASINKGNSDASLVISEAQKIYGWLIEDL